MATSYYTTNVWNGWTDSTSSTASLTTTGYGDSVWYTWNSASGTSANTTDTSTTSGSVWVTWVAATEVTEKMSRTYGAWKMPELTKEQKAEQKRQAEEAKKKEEERLKLEREREAKAKKLLEMVLDAQQRKQLEEKACFELVSVKSGNRYRVRKGDCGNVEKLDANGKTIEKLCFHPKDDYKEGRGRVHHYDTMTIQKLMLENEEDEARQIANISRVVNG